LSLIPAADEKQAVEIANDIYGLNASVFIADVERAREVAGQLRSGTVGHNSWQTDFGMAFGGFKQSGVGREGGEEGLRPFLETKAVILDGPQALRLRHADQGEGSALDSLAYPGPGHFDNDGGATHGDGPIVALGQQFEVDEEAALDRLSAGLGSGEEERVAGPDGSLEPDPELANVGEREAVGDDTGQHPGLHLAHRDQAWMAGGAGHLLVVMEGVEVAPGAREADDVRDGDRADLDRGIAAHALALSIKVSR
jgi:hypothetical protein